MGNMYFGRYGFKKKGMIGMIGMVCIIWQMVRMYEVTGKLLQAVQSFYVDSCLCVCVGMDVCEWFLVNIGLR